MANIFDLFKKIEEKRDTGGPVCWIIAGLGNSDVNSLLNSATNTLQAEMNRLKNLK